MTINDMLNPNVKISDSHPLWYWMALGLMAISIILAIAPIGPEAIAKSGGGELNLLALKPGMTGALLSVVFMSALFVRGCIRIAEHPLIYPLLIGDLIIFASYLEIVFTGSNVVLFQMPSWWPFKDPSISPRFLAVAVIVLTFIGARAIAGLGIVLLAFVTLLHMTKVDEALGWRGIIFIVASYISLLVQLKIPGMRVDKGNGMKFFGQLGSGILKVGTEAKENLVATGKAVEEGARLAAKGVAVCATGGATSAVGAAVAIGQVQNRGSKGKEALS